MNKVDNRQVNFELLRVISMILIILYHMVLYGVYDGGLFNSYRFSYALFMSGGKIGVILFIMITGYFMCKSQITIEKFLKLLLEVIFYSLVFNTLFFIKGYVPLTLENLYKGFVGTGLSHSFIKTFLVFFYIILDAFLVLL